MDFELSDEQEAFRGVVRSFAMAEIAPYAADWDRDETFPVDTVLAMGELGLFGLVFPEAYGGSDAPFSTLCIAIEEIGRVDQSLGITLSAGVGLGANPIYSFGTEDQRQHYHRGQQADQQHRCLAALGAQRVRVSDGMPHSTDGPAPTVT